MRNQKETQFNQFLSDYQSDVFLQKQHLTGTGPVFQFEKRLAGFYRKKYCVTYSSATTAIFALGVALNFRNKRLVVPDFGWPAFKSLSLLNTDLLYSGCTANTLSLDPDSIPNPEKTKFDGVFVIDQGGIPAEADQIRKCCDRYGKIFIQDCSQSLGAFQNGKPSGHSADYIILSFSAGKTIYTGEGGALLTDNEDVYEKLIWISQHPLRHKLLSDLTRPEDYGTINGRINPFGALAGLHNFGKAFEILIKRQETIFQSIQKLKKTHPHLIFPELKAPDSSTYFETPVLLPYGKNLNQKSKFHGNCTLESKAGDGQILKIKNRIYFLAKPNFFTIATNSQGGYHV